MKEKEIRALIERRRKEWRYGNSVEAKYKAEECKDILELMDEQEEPVSGNIDFEHELYKAFGQVKDFTLGMQIAKRFYDMGKNSQERVSEEFEEALAQEWKGYNDRGAATVDALEDNTQELAFAKGFYRGAKWGKNQAKVEFQAQSMALAHGCPKEPVSEDIQKIGSLKSFEYYPEKKTTNKTDKGVFDANMPRRKAYLRGFKDGAHADAGE